MAEDQTSREKGFGWKKTLVYSLLPVVCLLIVLEGAGRVIEIWIPPRQVDLGQGFSSASTLFVPSASDPDLMVTNPQKEVSFEKQEFRREKPPRSMRIFALGGSSVKYLDHEFPLLAQRLQQKLGNRYDAVQIVNCGGLSYGSHRLVLVAAEILGYDPDLVLVYSGHNEFEELEQLKLADLPSLPLQRLLSKSALCRFLRDRVASYRIGELQKAHDQRAIAESIPDAGRTWMHKFTEEEVAERMHAYRNNLAVIIQMCLDHDVPVIVGTVPSNLVKPNLPGPDGARYQEVLDLFAQNEYEKGLELARGILKQAIRHQSSDIENGALRALARQYGIPLADVEAAVIAAEPHHVPGETLFSDHCHLNPEGNKILAATYEEQILRLFR